MRASSLFVAAACAASLLVACTQDQNSSNSERDTHMGVTRMSPLAPALPEVPVAPAPAPAPAPAAAAASAPTPAPAPKH
jgi:hypothetical protein